jgi:hypothetical protein
MTDCPQSFIYATTFYVSRIFNYLSVIFSCISAFIWLRVIRNEQQQQQQQQKGQMFKYFFVSSIVEAIFFIIGSPDADYYKDDKLAEESFAWNVWYIYFYTYTYLSLVTTSNYMELAATFDCYIVIKNKFKFMHTKKCFNIILTTIIVSSFIIHFSYLLSYVIRVEYISNNNGTTDNATTIHYEYHRSFMNRDILPSIIRYDVFISVVREALPLVLLVLVNILIFKTLRQVMIKKREIQNRNNDTSITNVELNKLKMIIAICLDYYVLRTPMALYYILYINVESVIWNCLYFYGYAFYILSYSLKFFIYYFFNKKFKQYTNLSLKFR